MLNSLSNIDNWSAVYAEDSRGYLLVADYFLGADILPEDIPLLRYRLFSPVIPFFASVLGKATGITAAFLCVNILLWLATVLIFYELLKILLRDNSSAFAGGLILTSSLPVIEWGLPVMTDMGAYFFASLILLLFFCFRDKKGFSIFYGLIIAVAILTKPILVTLLVFVCLGFLSDKRRQSAIMVFASCLILTFGAYSVFHLSLDDFKIFGGPRHRGIFYLFSAAVFCFNWGWFFFFKGWRSETVYKKYCFIYLASFFTTYLIFVHNPRLFFICYPAVILFIVKGIRSKYPEFKRMIFVTCAYMITSNVLAAFHLYVMRTMKLRDMDALKGFILSFL